MKHSLKITIIMLTIFLLAQFIGIGIIYNYIDTGKSLETGETVFKELPIGERPPVEEGTSFIFIILAVLIGTGLLLLIIKYNWIWIWKIWFLLAVVIALTIAGTAFMKAEIALVLALGFAIWKIFKPNVWVQNITELFIYGGLAAIFVPMFNMWSVTILLVLISIYDAYAVWKSKHMITLAKSQTKAKIFAGLMIPYTLGKNVSKTVKKKIKDKKKTTKKVSIKVRTAVLGGGDIAFPLIFAGVILKEIGLWQALIIPFFALLGLGILMWKGKEKKFYPAMPFISAGCFLGLGIIYLLGLFI
jgi:presenilin-like A22 family membrane protease